MKKYLHMISTLCLFGIMTSCGDNDEGYFGKYTHCDDKRQCWDVYVHEDATWMAYGMEFDHLNGQTQKVYYFGHVAPQEESINLVIDGGNTTHYNPYNGVYDVKGEIFDEIYYKWGDEEPTYKKDKTWTENRQKYFKELKEKYGDKINVQEGVIYRWEKRGDGDRLRDGDQVYGEMIASVNGNVFFDNTGHPQIIASAELIYQPSLQSGLLSCFANKGDKLVMIFDADEWVTVNWKDKDKLPSYEKGKGMTIEFIIDIQDVKKGAGSVNIDYFEGFAQNTAATSNSSCAGTYVYVDNVEDVTIKVEGDNTWTATGYVEYENYSLGNIELSGSINAEGQLVVENGTFSGSNIDNGSDIVLTVPQGYVFGKWRENVIDVVSGSCGFSCVKQQ